MIEETAYAVFVSRRDGTAPKLRKALNDKLFFSLEEAQSFAGEISKAFECRVEVRELSVSVGDWKFRSSP